MPRDYRLFLEDIVESVNNIREYTARMNYEDFCKDRKTQDAVVRNLEIIGEAAGNLPESFRKLMSEIEWRKIIGIRNILIHEYFGISLPIIWDVLQNKLNLLKDSCQKLLESGINSSEKR